MSFGIALPLVSLGFWAPADIVNLHKQVCDEHGKVYFSTSSSIDSNKAKGVSFVLLISRKKNYIARVIDYKWYTDSGIPDDAAVYSPREFSAEKKVHWFLLTDLREVSEELLEKVEMFTPRLQQRYGSVWSYLTTSKRLQVFYVQTKEDIL